MTALSNGHGVLILNFRVSYDNPEVNPCGLPTQVNPKTLLAFWSAGEYRGTERLATDRHLHLQRDDAQFDGRRHGVRASGSHHTQLHVHVAVHRHRNHHDAGRHLHAESETVSH